MLTPSLPTPAASGHPSHIFEPICKYLSTELRIYKFAIDLQHHAMSKKTMQSKLDQWAEMEKKKYQALMENEQGFDNAAGETPVESMLKSTRVAAVEPAPLPQAPKPLAGAQGQQSNACDLSRVEHMAAGFFKAFKLLPFSKPVVEAAADAMGWKGTSKSVPKPDSKTPVVKSGKKAQSKSSDEDEAEDEGVSVPEVPKSKSGIKRKVDDEDEPEPEDSENPVDLLVKFINMTNSIADGKAFFGTIEGIKMRQKLTATAARDPVGAIMKAMPGLPAFCFINELQLDATAQLKACYKNWLQEKFGVDSYDGAVQALKNYKKARALDKV